MAATGVMFDPGRREEAHSLTQEPTDSHALAMADHEVKGVAQLPHNEEVQDLGWNEPESIIPAPLVGGLPNEELWKLVRRFNKVRHDLIYTNYHLLTCPNSKCIMSKNIHIPYLAISI